MSGTWLTVVVASACVLGIKIVGYLVPHRVVDHPQVTRTASLVTVSLLAALVAVQTGAGGEAGRHLVVDARAAGLLVAAIALWRRAPFLLVVVLAAATAALVRCFAPGA